ncbi:hypothetical protein GCM10011506_01080 [Marivirga lumbricoides]|uniref:DUF3857 domain-containing protein n=1 Tax=Marivirga lumbricoides TaxID=1046115 RepID=A0ABQ1L839_9BACT|nr:hypothetical protein GCM10011506_01080 [Marivirga lumbricoides]
MRFLFLISLLLLQFLPVFSQQIKTTKAPGWIKSYSWTDDSEKPYTTKGIHNLLLSHQYNLQTEEVYVKNAYKIVDANGISDGATIQISFDPTYEKLSIHSITIHRGNQKSKEIAPDFMLLQREENAEINMYDGSYTAIMNLEDIRVGDIIEFEHTIQGMNPVQNGLFSKTCYLKGFYSISRRNIEVINTSQNKLTHYSSSGNLKELVKTPSGYTVNLTELEGIKYEDQAPLWYEFSDFIIFTQFNQQKFTDWSSRLFSISSSEHKSVSNIVEELIAGESTKIGMAEKLINFTQDEIRYLSLSAGMSAYKPKGPAKALKDRYGDCKDKSLLLVTMLKSIGINAFPVLVNTYDREHVADLPLTPQIFNHCIVMLEWESKSIFIDPTISQQGGTLYNTYLPDYGKGYIVTDTSVTYSDIPQSSNGRTEITQDFYIKGSQEPVQFKVLTEYYGRNADEYRPSFELADQQTIKDSYIDHYERFFDNVEFSSEIESLSYPETNLFKVLENYELKDFWKDPKNPGLQSKAIYAEIVYNNMLTEFQKRRNSPLSLNFPTEIIQRIYIHMPEPTNFYPDWQEVKNEFFEFSRSLSYDSYNQKVNFICKFKVLKDHVPPNKVEYYKARIEQVNELLGIEIDPPLQGNLSAGTTSTINWPFIVAGIFLTLLFTFLATILNKKFDPVSKFYRYRYEKIEGVLWLVCIGLLISPILIIKNLVQGIYFDSSVWSAITSTQSANFNPFLAFILSLDFAFTLLHLVFCGLIIYQFFKKRSSLRSLITVFYALNLSYAMGLIILNVFFNIELNLNPFIAFLKAFIAAAIWIPYFQISNRAKETFVYQRKPVLEEKNRF